MPNGGIPQHMILTPRADGRVVLYCHGSELHIIDRKAWEESGTVAGAKPLATLNKDESRVLERFLRYWLEDGDDGALLREPDVKAVFAF